MSATLINYAIKLDMDVTGVPRYITSLEYVSTEPLQPHVFPQVLENNVTLQSIPSMRDWTDGVYVKPAKDPEPEKPEIRVTNPIDSLEVD